MSIWPLSDSHPDRDIKIVDINVTAESRIRTVTGTEGKKVIREDLVSLENAKWDEEVFARIECEQGARGSAIKEYQFDMKQVEVF
ncbi:hypothetical protein V8D89_012094 [Ganoderma adspersum]